MDLTVLGAGPAYTDRPGATGAAYLVRAASTSILLDLGHGSFSALARAIEPSRLDSILVSHLHPDHFIDLVALRHYLRYEFRPGRRVHVAAPAGLASRLDALHDEPGFTAAAFDVADLVPGPRSVGTLEIEARRVTHTSDSYAFRITDGAGPGLVYSGDCGRAADLIPLARAGDTLLVEVSFGPGPVPAGAAHLDGPAVGELAASSRVARVLLTHLQMGFDRNATLESVRARFGGPVELVDPGFATPI
ncbi:MAG TPA: MBL fold metallo-hydrolase [Candidatus Limnocylindrales bacterium]